MTYDQFVGQVQHRAHLGSKGEAVNAIEAVLTTLAERLDPGEAKDMASQLPREFAIYCQRGEHAVRMSLNEFFQAVSLREKVDAPAAAYHARVVTEVLQEAVSPGEMADVRGQLPREWDALFEAGSEGPMRLGKAR